MSERAGLRGRLLRYHWGAGALLGVAGYLLNLHPVALSPGTELVFGGVAYLLAAIALGPGPGLLAAGIASSRILWLWHHPYAWLIFTAEAAVVGYLTHRWERRALVADLLYWIVVGVPLLFLTYYLLLGVHGSTAAVLFLKQPFNGLIDTLAAEALFLVPGVRRLLRAQGPPRLRSALAVVVTLTAVTPTLVFGVWSGRQEWDRNVENARERLSLFAESYAGGLGQYVALHQRAVSTLALAAQQRGTFDPQQLQRLLAAEHGQFPGLANMYAADSRAVTVAFDPPVSRQGRPLVGLDFSDRPYYRLLRRTRRAVLSDVFAGRGGLNEPVVVIAYPIVLADTLAGYVVGALDLKRLPGPVPAPGTEERLRVADSLGTLVFDSRNRYRDGERPRSVRDSLAFAAVRALGESGGTTSYQPDDRETPAAAVADQQLAGVVRIPSLGWWVWVEQPFAEIQGFVAEAYVRLLALLIAVTLITLGISDVLALYLARPLLRLREVASALGEGNLRARVGALPSAAPMEIAELGRGFDEMAASLAGRTEELEELGEIARSLASTLDTEELLRRITDAAVRLVRPDGCGIALLRPGRQTLRAADYTLGLLAPVARREIPAEGSLIGWVVREATPVLLLDAARDERVQPSYIDAERVASVICAPLVGRSGPLGTLTAVRSRSTPHPFSEADLRLLERLARHAAVAVENAHLVAAERRRARESEAIRVVARTVSAAQGLRETLAVIVRETARIVRSEACTVALVRGGAEGEPELEVVAAYGASGTPLGTVLPVEGRLLESSVGHAETTLEDRDGFVASVPLRVGEETLGVLTAIRRDDHFGSTDAALLSAFADHAAIALRNARLLEAAQEASRAKSDFIATMSHELRTPLNAVLGHLELLEMGIHGDITDAQREALGRIGAASRHLRGLIEEVLSFARLEAGRVEVHVAETDVYALAEEVAAVIEPLAREKRLGFEIERGGALCPVPTDADKVRQILINLAGNAVKFTDRGEVRIRVEARGDKVVLAVADTGPGIEAADRERLFRPFEQLESGFSRAHGGTGLGLYLSGRYAALIGGRIELSSEPGRGSTFALVLPARGPELPTADGTEKGEPAPSGAGSP
ncbi:MAG: GAF domain-containing protein [Gemmatimonadetes bacterium]|nr:GAF domain-containing protein [Gemmatimonadota bacterium]